MTSNSEMSCFDCGKDLFGGGFSFKTKHLDGVRCFDCLTIELDKTKGWLFIELLSNELQKIPKINGRKYKAYATELKEQRSRICDLVALAKTMKPDFVKMKTRGIQLK